MAQEPLKIFIVEDDVIFAKIMSHHLTLNPEYEVEIFPDGRSLLKNLYKNPTLISLDYNLPDMTGLEVLKHVREFNPDLPVVIVSGQQDVATAIELLKKGAYDYILKDQDTKERLWNITKNIRENIKLRQKIADLEEEIGRKYENNNLIKGNSPAISKVFTLIEKASRTNITVSIYGETGTGKELVAKSIHHASPRSRKPFVAVNVTAIPKELIESEMFGHEKGAFTGANNRRIGRFEEANQGTIFLDEIGDMDLNMQSKLLRVLQEEEVTRVGGNENVKLDVRVIVATHKNLQELVRKGEFREDLYYRLLGLPVNLPPLRERGNDIALLARFFVDDFCLKNKMKKLSITPKAIEKIQKYPFPGNVRELKAIMELASVMTNTETIEDSDITFSTVSASQDFLYEETTLEEYNKKIINHFMQKYNNRVRQVAQKLDIGKTTIYRLMSEGKL
ncbi:MAG: sigma-54-dependent Fis family transcriptional regulator [Bacteroidales bacterium]|nr:sigma-54-dependent Fis family transcriptional regulator [Bacteroidales bacterium]MBK9356226.1 sigma-54-dependent Fis family transcriptional regulator [Bacteroidales bacterium]